ncbi:MAG: type II CRISPR RNA-guided endonuclease Cas9 [Pirellulales bacterium]|nr:type II CRISPR RNA-guided endonuclease Cas9 [Pirellulales bacterium]
MANLVLGLDLGPNSIGWALVEDDTTKPEKSKLIDLGVRIFPEGVDNFDTSKEVSRNENRRITRGMRRQIRRRARRRRQLKESLQSVGLWPQDSSEEQTLYDLDPYELRSRGLKGKLSPYEFGRVLLHLNQRRGFLSNRKKDRGDKEVKGMLAKINELASAMEADGSRTLGEHFAKKLSDSRLESVRGKHTRRSMYEEEFEAIWEAQRKHHPNLLTDLLKYGKIGQQKSPVKPIARNDERREGTASDLEAFGLHGLIFFQRPMYWPKSVIGLCELEPKEKRCARGDRRAQRFRLLQEVNNLRYTDPDARDECILEDTQRKLLLDYLGHREKATFADIKKKLGFLETVKFNLENGKRPGLKGAVVDYEMAKATGKNWHDRPEDDKNDIVRMLLDNDREDDLVIKRLIEEYGFTADQANSALDVDFPAGYLHLSLKAIEKLLPHMERGLVYQAESDPERSALHAAGYLRRDELHRRLFDKLPDPTRTRRGDLKIGEIPNPVVKRSLVELRKVVNAIIREYGKPDAVHLEMTRSLQMGPKTRSEYNSRMREREAAREKAADEIKAADIKTPDGNRVKVNHDSILRQLLWEEQGHECVYCGKTISQKQLFGGEVDVDHILPYSRCLDDSQLNKVVCHRKCNGDKKNNTPYEWLAAEEPKAYERLLSQVGSLLKKGAMPYAKYRRFLQKELELDRFIARQLTDTGYITQATGEYLRCLFEKDHQVLGLKGQLTAELRWQWGLDTILQELPDSPAWQEAECGNLRAGEKNRADHRHHAIDAVVVALTNRSRLKQLSESMKRGGAKQHGEVLEDPWDGFRETIVDAIKSVNVSHRVERKVRGGLHKDKPFGRVKERSLDLSNATWVKRKPLIELSASEILHIRDSAIREIVLNHLRTNNIEIKTTKPKKGRPKTEFMSLNKNAKLTAKELSEILSKVKMPSSGVPVKKARILIKNETVQKIRQRKADSSGDPTLVAYVEPDDLHHACLFQWHEKGKTVSDAVYVTRLEAARRKINNECVIRRLHPKRNDAKFLFSICTGDLVLAINKGRQELKKVSTMVSTQKRIHLVDARDARRSAEKTDIGLTPNTFLEKYQARKVLVDPLGRIRWAND